MCRVSRSSFEGRKKSRAKEEQRLEEKKKAEEPIKETMRAIAKSLGYVPGERGFKVFLWRDYGINVGRKLINRLMKEMHIVANTPKKDAYKGMAKHDHPCTAPDNLVNQNFRIAPRKIICTDITYLYFGVLRTTIYLCVFRDAYTKEILGWALKNLMTTQLIKAAYDMMMKKHGEELKNPDVIIHSDQGCQYLSTTFKQLLEDDGFLQSVSARANSQDNAAVESFFARLKTVVLDLIARCRNIEQAERLLEGYFDSYNNKIYQLDLAGLTPHEFYLYCKTGIYPCDNYFGVEGTELRSLESIVNAALAKAEEKARKMREIYQERSRAAQLLKKDPLQLTIDDQKILRRVIDRYTKHRDMMTDEIERLSEVLRQAEEAESYMAAMSEEERARFHCPQAWQNDTHLQYIYGMGGLF
jgi:transposase InsO family protein